MRIAVLLNGELRIKNKNHLKQILYPIRGCDIFIATYPKYSNLAKLFRPKVTKIIEEELGLQIPNMNQWFLYNECFQLLEEYQQKVGWYFDFVVRLRTDIDIGIDNLPQFIKLKKLGGECIYIDSDLWFCGSYVIMKKVTGFINKINSYVDRDNQYIPINYNLLEKCDLKAGKFSWLNYPAEYVNDIDYLEEVIHKKKKELTRIKDPNIPIISNKKFETIFSSEKCFLLFLLHQGIPIKQLQKCKLFSDRREFNYY